MFAKRSLRACALALSCAILVSVSAASFAGELSETIFLIQAEAAGVSGSFTVPLTSGGFMGDTFGWDLPEPMPLIAKGGFQIGVLERANVRYVADPIVVLNFVVSSGGAAANFTVTSANLSFPGIANAMGRAQGGVSVTDFGGDGATLQGNFPSNNLYRAFYNDAGNVPATGTTFATLTPGVTASAFSGSTSSGAFPDNVGGFSSTDQSGGSLGTVTSMSSQWRFSVSANDSASGTSVYVIVPEPASVILSIMGIVVLGLYRRR